MPDPSFVLSDEAISELRNPAPAITAGERFANWLNRAVGHIENVDSKLDEQLHKVDKWADDFNKATPGFKKLEKRIDTIKKTAKASTAAYKSAKSGANASEVGESYDTGDAIVRNNQNQSSNPKKRKYTNKKGQKRTFGRE